MKKNMYPLTQEETALNMARYVDDENLLSATQLRLLGIMEARTSVQNNLYSGSIQEGVIALNKLVHKNKPSMITVDSDQRCDFHPPYVQGYIHKEVAMSIVNCNTVTGGGVVEGSNMPHETWDYRGIYSSTNVTIGDNDFSIMYVPQLPPRGFLPKNGEWYSSMMNCTLFGNNPEQRPMFEVGDTSIETPDGYYDALQRHYGFISFDGDQSIKDNEFFSTVVSLIARPNSLCEKCMTNVVAQPHTSHQRGLEF